MTILATLLDLDFRSLVYLTCSLLVLGHVIPWLLDPHAIRAYPGPFLAKFTDLWLGRVAALGHRSEVVHEMHKKHGKFVRIAPNHLSIADPDALQVVYAHGNGSLKSNFYDAFVSIQRGLFNTRSRPAHARKRKIVSHIFSQKSVLEFEPHVRLYVSQLFKHWDRLCEGGLKGMSGDDGEGGWKGRNGRVWFDCLPWYNYLAFDIIGDLAFGFPFGMLQSCRDAAPVAVSHEEAIAGYGADDKLEVKYLPAVQVINDRGTYSASMGVLAPWMRPIAKKLPWFNKGSQAVKSLAGIAIAAVAQRLKTPSDRRDLLGKLQEGKDDEGKPMGKEELTAEALTELIAGSDTTSNSSCAITYYLAHNPHVQSKLQKELDEALSEEDDPVTTFQSTKSLPYLEAVINESLRLHATSGIGLPRLVPEGGLTVCGRTFPEGTCLSVPTYTIHRNKEVWGEDADEFRPERWFELDKNDIQKAFNPFSYGPRSCVGRNLASMELLIIVASIFRRYDFVLEQPEKHFDTVEGFLRKPVECIVGMRRRVV
ncbi:cytochrome P450 monooxygenase pc-bph [Cristinia sonorae]|uniref:Cytochrome P450 monooxygenase pc-bph n=1 Tax=Cristinia sonorae TaxID=1940300 RepID=A0A8K0USY2_9AGAR|nr:cytochrome P450 monooxygenase pc-bph [Cristinia sonorae]